MAPSLNARRSGFRAAAPLLLLLCLGSASASDSVRAFAAATPGAAARATATTSGSGPPLTVTAVAPPPLPEADSVLLPVVPRSGCGNSGLRCCTADDEEDDPCIENTFCSSGICVTCGFAGDMCCPGANCTDSTTTCNADNLCETTCGALDLPCCTDAQDDYAPDGCPGFDTLCVSDVCVACGGVGEPCCNDNECEKVGSECDTKEGVCGEPTCGGPGLPCCDGADYAPECEFSSQCVDGSCVECGTEGEPCCSPFAPDYPGYCYDTNGECTDEGICAGGQPDAPAPAPLPAPGFPTSCGFGGRQCCGKEDDFPACDFSSFCSSGTNTCASCGFQGSSCCTDGKCFQGECNDNNICIVTCGVTGLRCCTEDDFPDGAYGPDAESPRPAFSDVDPEIFEPFFYECSSPFAGGAICTADNVCTPCGEVGEPCCKDDLCTATQSKCDTEKNVCAPPTCGVEGLPCCDPDKEDGFDCDTRLGCFDGKCETCGFDGLQCCPEGIALYECYGDVAECSAENTCTNALPADGECGFPGDPCCEGGRCVQETICDSDTCTFCGYEDAPCCVGGACDYAAECTNNVCGPPVCGQVEGPCCTADLAATPCDSGLCVDGKCASCGFSGEPCCPTGRPCVGESAECTSENICEGDGDYAPYPTPEPAVLPEVPASPPPLPAPATPPPASKASV